MRTPFTKAGGALAKRDALDLSVPVVNAILAQLPKEGRARILSQAVKELAAMPAGAYAIVSICADGGQGSVALLRND